MIQEKPTSLRILQPSKKNSLSPALYILIGFILGILFSGIAMLFLFRDSSAPAVVESSEKAFTQSNSSLAAHTAHAESAPTLLVTQEQIQATEEEPASANDNDNDNDNDFIQPKESELSKLFTPPPVTPTATPPRVSPFEHKAAEVKNLHTIPKTAPHLETKKRETAPANAKIEAKSEIIPVKENEPELPKASLQIKVTQKPFSLDES
ncbi:MULTISPECIES: DUF4064 domain-containing protein [Acinetobacter]|uniref:DUF4064 domain-containing protein n=1 Tax=Acinetobacter TaxID=469 RepID=UPI000451E8FB|nr:MULTISPECIES: DUF4064 domain-containing protein [Acinetobacter]EXB84280.1 hypothetical protein J538_1975 [Acinetobacter sp. 272263]MDU4032202.1 DUF4064 domain-containing protein [Acinetobacter sp.]RJL73390.1 hypothetical protein D5055_04420 [Acinetobacter radioresistens]